MEKIPCNPEQKLECPVYQLNGGCYEDVHHEYYPRRKYKTPIEKEFRQLDINKQLICRAVHNAIHATEQPPKKPKRSSMLEIIRRERESRN